MSSRKLLKLIKLSDIYMGGLGLEVYISLVGA